MRQHLHSSSEATGCLHSHSNGSPGAFPPLCLPGCNEMTIPLLRMSDKLESAVNEERRLFYVSLTRAKKRLRLSHTLQNTHFGRSK